MRKLRVLSSYAALKPIGLRLLAVIFTLLFFISCNSSQQDESVRFQFEELVEKESSELRIIRNEIFARHGYIFKSQDLVEYFGDKKWYEPKHENVARFLTADERKHIEIILQAEEYVKQREYIKDYLTGNSMTTIGKVKLPEKLSFFIESLGKPDSTFIDPDLNCPVGQLHYWSFENENLSFVVLGDTYGEPVSFDSNTRLLVFKRIENNKTSDFLTFNKIKLNDTEESVKKHLDNFVRANPEFEFEILDRPTPIDIKITQNLGKIYYLTDKQVYFHFVIDNNGKLEYIIQTTISTKAAC